jgi:transcriptional regulator with XRE-family HTH domain
MTKRRSYGTPRQGVPHRLREMRQFAGLTLEELADAVGMTAQTIQKYETEPQRLRVADLDKFAEALGCSRAALVGDDAVSPEDAAFLARLHQLNDADRTRLLQIVDAWSQTHPA